MHPRFVEMRDFLIEKLKRELTDQELDFITWLSGYERATHDQAMKLFRELAK